MVGTDCSRYSRSMKSLWSKRNVNGSRPAGSQSLRNQEGLILKLVGALVYIVEEDDDLFSLSFEDMKEA